MTNDPIIAFAKRSSDRDFLRTIFKGWDCPILFFESETICFDNLLSVKPRLIVIKTNSRTLVWRFIFALYILEVNSAVLVLTNEFEHTDFNLDGIHVKVQCHALGNNGCALRDSVRNVISNYRSQDFTTRQGLLIGKSAGIKRINESLSGLKASIDPILISGERGTGKELLVRRIANQAKDDSIFIKVNCSHFKSEHIGFVGRDDVRKISKAVFHGNGDSSLLKRGTIFFDKINRLNPRGQSEVLALLEDGFRLGFDFSSAFRIVATAEVDLDQLVLRNRFRQDLYYRLNVISVNLPPLRQRKEDIPLLVDYIAIDACSRQQRSYVLLPSQTVERMFDYHWPGNVEELKQAVTRFAASGNDAHIFARVGLDKKRQQHQQFQYLEDSSLPDSVEIRNCLSVVGSMPLKNICDMFIEQTEKRILQKALETTNWNRKKAAGLLSISYKSMLNKIKAYDII